MKKIKTIFLMIALLFLMTACVVKDKTQMVIDENLIGYNNGDSKNSVKSNILLPKTSSVSGASIEWTSSHPSIIRVDRETGIVTRPNGSDVEVTLTITVTVNGKTKSKDYSVKVIGIPIVQYKVSFDPTGGKFNTFVGFSMIQSGQKATAPEVPVKENHQFLGWYLEDTLFDFNEVIQKHMTLIAKWESLNADYSVHVYYESIDGVLQKQDQLTQQKNGRIGSTVSLEVSIPEGFELSLETPLTYTIVENGVARIDLMRKTYQVSFKLEDGSLFDTKSVKYQQTVQEASDPVKDHHLFLGWYLEDEKFDFSQEITQDIVLVAKWEEQKVTYYVQYHYQNIADDLYETRASETVTLMDYIGTEVLIPISIPRGFNVSKETNTTFLVVENGVADVYYDRVVYSVTIDYQNTDPIEIINVKFHDVIEKPTQDPVKFEHQFIGWFYEGVLYDFNQLVTRDMTLVAKWEALRVNYSIEFYYENIEDASYTFMADLTENKEGLIGDSDQYTIQTPEGFVLKDLETTISYDIVRNMTIEIYFDRVIYEVTFGNHNQENIHTQHIKYQGHVKKPNDPIKQGYRFIEWQLNGKGYAFDQLVIEDVELIAHYEAGTSQYQVFYYLETESVQVFEIYEKARLNGTTLEEVEAEVRVYQGYQLVSGQALSNIISADGKMIIHVYYERVSYQVTFDEPGYETVYVRYQMIVDVPEDPVKIGYNFICWLKGSQAFSFDAPITENIVLSAYYEARNVKFVIENYLQNLENDDYQKYESIELEALSDSVYLLITKHYEGFSMVPNHETSYTISADGNTVIQVYYDRVVYEIIFNTMDGGDTPNQYVRYEAHLDLSYIPVKYGYVFLRWESDGIIIDENTYVRSSLYLVAQYQALDKVTITFDTDEGSFIQMQTVFKGDKATKPNNPVKAGYQFLEWQNQGILYTFDEIVTENIVLTAIYTPTNNTYRVSYFLEDETIGEYTVFESLTIGGQTDSLVEAEVRNYQGYHLKEGQTLNGLVEADGSLVIEVYYDRNLYKVQFNESGYETIYVRYRLTIEKPEDPVKIGYRFIGWIVDGSVFNFDTAITKDLEMVALFEANQVSYRVEHYYQNKEDDAYQQVKVDTKQALADTVVVVDRYIEQGFIAKVGQPYEQLIKADGTTVVTIYYDRIIYTIDFYVGLGSPIPRQEVRYGQTLSLEEKPVRNGYVFLRWEYEGNVIDSTHQVTQNMTLVAMYEALNTYIVSFDSMGGSNIANQVIYEGNKVLKPNNPVKEGYRFIEWRYLDETYDFTSGVYGDVVLSAYYEPTDVDYRVIHHLEEELENTYEVYETIVLNGLTDSEVIADVRTYVGYQLKDNQTLKTIVRADGTSTIHVYYDRIAYQVSFNEIYESQMIRYQMTANKPETPHKTGYQFEGWYLSGTLYQFNEPVTKDIILTAKWKDIQAPRIVSRDTLIYVVNGEVISTEEWLMRFQVVASDNHSAVDQLIFVVDDHLVDMTTDGQYNLYIHVYDEADNQETLILTVKVESKHKVVWQTSSSTTFDPIYVKNGDKIIKPSQTPFKEGFIFIGWYYENEAFDFGTIITESFGATIELVAKYQEKTTIYHVNFKVDDNIIKNEDVVNGAKVAQPDDPTKENYIFLGWWNPAQAMYWDFDRFGVTSNLELTARFLRQSNIHFVDDIENGVIRYQSYDSYRVYLTESFNVWFQAEDYKINITPSDLLNGDYVMMFAAMLIDSSSVRVILVTHQKQVYSILIDKIDQTATPSQTLLNIEIHANDTIQYLKYDIFGNVTMIAANNQVYMIQPDQTVLNITQNFDLNDDEIFIYHEENQTNEFNNLIQTNQNRYFLPIHEAVIHGFPITEGIYYVDVTAYIEGFFTRDILYVESVNGILTAYDIYLNRIIITGSSEDVVEDSKIMLEIDETIVYKGGTYFISSHGRLFFIVKSAETYTVLESVLFDPNKIQSLYIGVSVTLIYTYDDEYFIFENDSTRVAYQNFTVQMAALLESGHIVATFDGLEGFVIIGSNGKVIIIN